MKRREFLGGLATLAATPALADDNMAPAEDPKSKATFEKRDAYWSSIGKLETDVIAYIINPMFQNAPPWPNVRQAYRIVRPPNSLIIASDGLSDLAPGQESTSQGFGCEVFIEVPELAMATFDEIKSSWAFSAIENFAMNVAASEGISDAIQRYGILSMELPIDNAPAGLAHRQRGVGALINLPTPYPAKLSLPLADIDIIPLTLVTARELDRLVSGGAKVRGELAASRAARGTGHKTVSRT
jgi:hypothetical protein